MVEYDLVNITTVCSIPTQSSGNLTCFVPTSAAEGGKPPPQGFSIEIHWNVD